MKNLIYTLVLVSLLGCKNQSDNNEITKENKVASYYDWNNSIKEALENSNLEITEKENLLISIDRISKEDFLKLNNIIKIEGNSKEYYVFDISEGEVNTETLYCIKEKGKMSYLSNVTIQRGKKQFSSKMVTKKMLFSELIKNDDNHKYDYNILITETSKNNFNSFFIDINDEILEFLNYKGSN